MYSFCVDIDCSYKFENCCESCERLIEEIIKYDKVRGD
jgi:predicted Fe-S protein YdhL (DUF1289 family)